MLLPHLPSSLTHSPQTPSRLCFSLPCSFPHPICLSHLMSCAPLLYRARTSASPGPTCSTTCLTLCPLLHPALFFPTTFHLVILPHPPMATCSLLIHLTMGTTCRGPDDCGHEGGSLWASTWTGRGGCSARLWSSWATSTVGTIVFGPYILPQPTGRPRSPAGEALGRQVGSGTVGATMRQCSRSLDPHRAADGCRRCIPGALRQALLCLVLSTSRCGALPLPHFIPLDGDRSFASEHSLLRPLPSSEGVGGTWGLPSSELCLLMLLSVFCYYSKKRKVR